MRRAAVAAGAVGAMLGVAVLSTMGTFSGPFESSIGPTVLVNSQALGECTPELYYTQRRFNSQCWECNPIFQAIGGPAGMWTYCNTPFIPFESTSKPDPSGSGTAAGVYFGLRNAGTHYGIIGDISMCVEGTGTCTGGCPAGTHAVLEVQQQNREDGGVRTIAVGRIPCTAPLGYCVSNHPDPRNGSNSDAGVWGLFAPTSVGGVLAFHIKADGGQCSEFGNYGITGWFMPGAYGDGGGS